MNTVIISKDFVLFIILLNVLLYFNLYSIVGSHILYLYSNQYFGSVFLFTNGICFLAGTCKHWCVCKCFYIYVCFLSLKIYKLMIYMYITQFSCWKSHSTNLNKNVCLIIYLNRVRFLTRELTSIVIARSSFLVLFLGITN